MKTCLYVRGVDTDVTCPLCQQAPKTIIHALRGCAVINLNWYQLGRGPSDSLFYGSDLLEWLEINGKANSIIFPNQISWKYIFLFAVCTIWLKRNLVVFNNKNPHSTIVVKIRNKASEYVLCALCPKNMIRLVDRLKRWERLRNGWRKLNTDGWSLGNPKLVGGGCFEGRTCELGDWIL